MPAYHYRFNPAIRSARAAVVGGSIGLPWAVHAEFIIANGTAAWPLGELLNFGLYPVDAIRAVLGLEARSVYATSGAFFYDGDADDLSVLALTFERGVIATTSVGRAPTQGHPNGYGGDRRLRIMGSHGTLAVDAAAPSLSVYGERADAALLRRRVAARAGGPLCRGGARRTGAGARSARRSRGARDHPGGADLGTRAPRRRAQRRYTLKLVTFRTESDGVRHGVLRGDQTASIVGSRSG